MPKTIQAPCDLLEELADFQFPPSLQERFTLLMDRNTEGTLTMDERAELRSLVEINERIAILKGRAMLVLGRKNG